MLALFLDDVLSDYGLRVGCGPADFCILSQLGLDITPAASFHINK